MNIETVRKGYKLIDEGMKVLGSGPLDYYLMRLTDCYELLLTYAPHQIGNPVRMNRTPPISERESWGWLPWRAQFVIGSRATVHGIEADKDGFRYLIEFDGAPGHKFHVPGQWLDACSAPNGGAGK